MRKRTKWPALVAIDRVSGDYLCGYVEWPRGKSKDEFRSYVRNYNQPIIRRATLSLVPQRKQKQKP